MKKSIIILFFAFLIFSVIAQSVPPFQTGEFTKGYIIKYPLLDYADYGQKLSLHFHIFNVTNGVPILNSTFGKLTYCYLHFYNSSGNHVFEAEQHANSDVFDWEFEVYLQNLTGTGEYSYIVQCNSTKLGGFDSNRIIFTPDGEPVLNKNVILPLSIALLIAILYFLLLSLINNQLGMKLICGALAYIEFIILLGCLYLTNLGYSISGILRINFYIFSILGFGIAMLSLYFLSTRLMGFDDENEDKDFKKWKKHKKW